MKKYVLSVACLLAAFPLFLRADETPPKASTNSPRPTPITRPAMKQLLEDMKRREPRIPLPALTADEQKQAESDPFGRGYEGRLRSMYLPGTDLRGYLYFAGSPARRPGSPPPRFTLEPDPAVTLDYGFKTKLFWIASRANNCQYCLGHQESKLLAVGLSDDDLGALDSDWTVFPAAEQAAFALARRLTLEPHRLTDADIDACRAHFKDLQILEMALSVGGNNAINRWKEGVGVPQSTGGGNFGGSSGTNEHSYLTPTSKSFTSKSSQVAALTGAEKKSDKLEVADTLLRRPQLETPEQLAAELANAARRKARLPMAGEEATRAVLKDLVPADTTPGWMRLLANYPIAGLRTATSFVATEKQTDLSPLLRAQMSWVVARQDRAWYALGEARARLKALGQTDAQIEALDGDQAGVAEKDRALLLVARNLGASPVVLSDAEFAAALKLNSPRDLVQTVHYVAMRALFDRFTEAAGLPIDP